jgi:hypothetical protein
MSPWLLCSLVPIAAGDGGVLMEGAGRGCGRARPRQPLPVSLGPGEARPHLIFTSAGTLDDPTIAKPGAMIWTDSAPRWALIDPDRAELQATAAAGGLTTSRREIAGSRPAMTVHAASCAA